VIGENEAKLGCNFAFTSKIGHSSASDENPQNLKFQRPQVGFDV
jgi:hypothetical protein